LNALPLSGGIRILIPVFILATALLIMPAGYVVLCYRMRKAVIPGAGNPSMGTIQTKRGGQQFS
jgi:hypothetical protein